MLMAPRSLPLDPSNSRLLRPVLSAVIRDCSTKKGGQWEMAMSLFEELTTRSDLYLVPDLYTYNTLMTVFSNSGMLARALELLEEAKAKGLRPDVVTYRQVFPPRDTI